jgi:tetratricopeptide (TPR) repeat protein
MYHSDRLTPEDLDLAEQYFERALEIDPDYALAHKGIAFLWSARQQFALVSPAEAQPNVRAAAQRALEADSTIADVHFTLALMRTWMDWDWAGGEEAFRRALELNANYAEARAYYSHLLVFLGRSEEAVEQADLAVALDPLNSLIGALSSGILLHIGRYEEAAAGFEQALRADPTQRVALDGIVPALGMLGRYDEFMAIQISRSRDQGDEELAQVLEQGYAVGGFERAMALKAEFLVARSEVEFVEPYSVAESFALSGDSERALDWLERGLDMHHPAMPYLVEGTWPEAVRNHPRLQEIRRRMGLPERD